MNQKEVNELCERSKDDRAFIAGSEVRQLTAEIQRLREALKWYAEDKNYQYDQYEVRTDRGERARKALEGKE